MNELCPACSQPLQGEDIRFCGDQEYRYFLKVPLSGGEGGDVQPVGGADVCLFLMLNPGSLNDDRKRHPTRERCERFAREWGYCELWTCNLFALRSPNPRDLRRHDDPVGADNDAHIREAAQQANIIVCAWGGWRGAHGRARQVVRTLINEEQSEKLHTLGFTKSGEPKHPKPQNPNDWPKADDLSQWQQSHIKRWLGAMRQT